MEGAQRSPRRKTHDEKRRARLHVIVQHPHDVWMLQAGNELRFLAEGLAVLGREGQVKELEGSQRPQVDMLPQVNGGKPTFPKHAQQTIGAQLLTNALAHASTPIQAAGRTPTLSLSGIAVERDRKDRRPERSAQMVSKDERGAGTMSLPLLLARRFLAEASASVLSRSRHAGRQMIPWAVLALLGLPGLIVHVHIIQHGGKILVPQKFLQRKRIIPQDEVPHREGMAEDVRADTLVGDPRAQPHTLHKQTHD